MNNLYNKNKWKNLRCVNNNLRCVNNNTLYKLLNSDCLLSTCKASIQKALTIYYLEMAQTICNLMDCYLFVIQIIQLFVLDSKIVFGQVLYDREVLWLKCVIMVWWRVCKCVNSRPVGQMIFCSRLLSLRIWYDFWSYDCGLRNERSWLQGSLCLACKDIIQSNVTCQSLCNVQLGAWTWRCKWLANDLWT
jgi:hypothetical protein